MNLFEHIQIEIKKSLTKNSAQSTSLDAVSQALIPAVLTVLVENHHTTLETLKDELSTKSDDEVLALPQVRRILDLSVASVCENYTKYFTEISLDHNAAEVVRSDIEALLKGSSAAWERVKEKTYQEILNDAHPGSHDERVYLWLEEIKKGTGIEPNVNEDVETFSKRAVADFLRSKK